MQAKCPSEGSAYATLQAPEAVQALARVKVTCVTPLGEEADSMS
jgi:hypothetical protein